MNIHYCASLILLQTFCHVSVDSPNREVLSLRNADLCRRILGKKPTTSPTLVGVLLPLTVVSIPGVFITKEVIKKRKKDHVSSVITQAYSEKLCVCQVNK